MMRLEECPKCEYDLTDACEQEYSGSYLDEFEMECPKCGAMLAVFVEYDPIFWCSVSEGEPS
jgi:hypothetical protein